MWTPCIPLTVLHFYELNVCVSLEFIHQNPNTCPTPCSMWHILGGGASKEIIKVQWDNKWGAPIQWDKCLYKKRYQGTCISSLSLSPPPSTCTKEKPYEHITRRQPSAAPGDMLRSHRLHWATPVLAAIPDVSLLWSREGESGTPNTALFVLTIKTWQKNKK